MSAEQNWPINTGREGIAINATAVSQAVALSGSDGSLSAKLRPDVLVDNPGPNDVYVAAGGSDVVATTLCVRVPAGSMQPWEKGGASHIAVICAAGLTQRVVVHTGEGA